MPHFLFTILVIAGTGSTAAAVHKHRRAEATLFPKAGVDSVVNRGARIDADTGTVASVPPLANLQPSFLEYHSARVKKDLMMFEPTLVGITPPSRPRLPDRLAFSQAVKPSPFFVPSKAVDELEVRRDRDRLLLFRGAQPQGAAVGIGVALFGAATILSAHAPQPFRRVFDGPVHLGPAIFDGGGMGAGVSGRGL